MRSTALLLGLGCAVMACSSDTTPVIYMDLQYQVRCLDCEPRGPDDAAHKIKVVEGEDDYNLNCTVVRSGGVRRVTFTASRLDKKDSSSSRVFEVRSASLDGDDNDASQCQVHVVEGDNTYDSTCSSDDPSGDTPCQATLSEKGGIISGSLFCDKIPNLVSATTSRYVVKPASTSDGAPFKIYGCKGL
jgi:hypothetical protein